jgi:hypothetical protein
MLATSEIKLSRSWRSSWLNRTALFKRFVALWRFFSSSAPQNVFTASLLGKSILSAC